MDSVFLFHNPLTYLGNFLSDFVSDLKFPADIKDAKTGKYLLSNRVGASRFGLSPKDYEKGNLHVKDIVKLIKASGNLAEEISRLDSEVYLETLTSIHKKHYLTRDGFVMIDEGIKKPVFGRANQVIAILSYGTDITSQADPFYLFSLYQDYYPNRKKAIEKFLRYLKIYDVFIELPTKHELLTLLFMLRTNASKYISAQMNISSRTIEEYKARLRAKLKIIGLNELLIKLRVRHEYEAI